MENGHTSHEISKPKQHVSALEQENPSPLANQAIKRKRLGSNVTSQDVADAMDVVGSETAVNGVSKQERIAHILKNFAQFLRK